MRLYFRFPLSFREAEELMIHHGVIVSYETVLDGGDHRRAQILTLIDTARQQADEVRWAVDISGRASALLIAHGQQVVDAPGHTVNR